MSLPHATLVVALVSIISNRIFAVGVGLWFHVPAALMLSLLIALDVAQIPLFYRLYEHGFAFMDHIPMVQRWLKRDWTQSRMGKIAAPLGGLGVMLVAAMPTLGGGIWSASFIAYGLRLNRRAGYMWIILGSLLSYFTLYWILDALVETVRYFAR